MSKKCTIYLDVFQKSFTSLHYLGSYVFVKKLILRIFPINSDNTTSRLSFRHQIDPESSRLTFVREEFSRSMLAGGIIALQLDVFA